MNIYNKKSVAGFSMVEMLIAVVVLSVGLIGIAALQAKGQQFNYVSYVRTQASFLAYDIMDRMRLNQKAHLDQDIISTYVNAAPAAKVTEVSSLSPNCDRASCSYQELAQYDLVHWFTALRNNLPEGDAEMKAEGDSLRIILKWSESRDPLAPPNTQEWVYQ